VAFLLVGLMAVLAATGSWLDAPPSPWNAPGAAVPAAPLTNPTMLPRCIDQERTPANAEEARVAAAGWRLERYWATERAGDVALVTATAGYDGMCRPWDFQAFVFASGRFVGTLAPAPMRSREDGVLVEAPQMSADGRLTARFTRYAPSDPLCCPSRGHTTVEYLVAGGVVNPTRIAQTAVPTQLPRTGGPPLTALLGLGGLLVYCSARLRHSKWGPSASRT
jgi:hypothetical protein